MTRRFLITATLLLLASVSFPSAARPAERARPLEITYYYLPG